MSGDLNPSLVVYDTLASLRVALQRALGRATPGAASNAAPMHFTWLRVVLDWQPALQAAGVEVVLLLKDRRLYVGKLVGAINSGAVRLALWGCGGAVTSFPTSLMMGASIVGPHDYREETEVRRRQRRGEPAHIGGKLPRQRRRQKAELEP